MERNARIILVSVFLVLTVVAVWIFYDWINANANAIPLEERLVEFEGSVSGLSIGSDVRYLGVPVGRVSSIKLIPERAWRVDVMIGTRQRLPDSAQLVAILEGQGITGLSVIELRDRQPGEGEFEVPAGAIPGLPSVLSQLSNSAGSVTESAATVLARINLLLNQKTITNLQQSVEHIRVLTGNLAAASNQLGDLTSSITRVSRELEKTLPDYRAVAQRLNQDVAPAVVAAGNSIRAASDALTGSLGENGGQLSHLMNKELPTLIGMTDELALALQRLNQTLGNITDEPGSLLYGERLKEVEISLE
ncbi:MAG: MlaD family protein [Gammaproteobacteria bacterium]|nr:MlaD family protein [Gammaproteobacteria bacterium]